MKYAYEKSTDKSMEDAEVSLRKALKERGFGVLTEIDAKSTLKSKLDVDIEPYKILGACNPAFAHEAIGAEPGLGVLLPCNCLLREQEGRVVVSCILPSVQMGKIGNPALDQIALRVEQLLKEAVDET